MGVSSLTNTPRGCGVCAVRPALLVLRKVFEMDSLLTPANIVVLLIVAVGLVLGFRRIAGMSRGKSCCSDGDTSKKTKRVVVADADPAHYPYCEELLIGGMSCDGCAENVTNALNGMGDTLATVDLATKAARVLTKQPLDHAAAEAAVKAAGYYVMKL